MLWLHDAANAVSRSDYLRDPDQPTNIHIHQIGKLTFPVYAAVRSSTLSTIQTDDQFYVVMAMTSSALAQFTAAWRQLTREEVFTLTLFESETDAKADNNDENARRIKW